MERCIRNNSWRQRGMKIKRTGRTKIRGTGRIKMRGRRERRRERRFKRKRIILKIRKRIDIGNKRIIVFFGEKNDKIEKINGKFTGAFKSFKGTITRNGRIIKDIDV